MVNETNLSESSQTSDSFFGDINNLNRAAVPQNLGSDVPLVRH